MMKSAGAPEDLGGCTPLPWLPSTCIHSLVCWLQFITAGFLRRHCPGISNFLRSPLQLRLTLTISCSDFSRPSYRVQPCCTVLDFSQSLKLWRNIIWHPSILYPSSLQNQCHVVNTAKLYLQLKCSLPHGAPAISASMYRHRGKLFQAVAFKELEKCFILGLFPLN